MRDNDTRRYYYWALIFFLFFGVISIIDGGTMINRGIRLMPNLAVLIIILIASNFQSAKFVLAFLAGIFIAAILAFFYELPIFSEIFYIVNILAYVALGFAVLSKIRKLKVGWFLAICFIVGITLTFYMFFQLSEISRNLYSSELQYFLVQLNNFGSIFVIASALLFVHDRPGKISMTFLIFAFTFVLAEFLRGASYYSPVRVNLFFYGCRILYVLSLAMLLYWTMISLKEELSMKAKKVRN